MNPGSPPRFLHRRRHDAGDICGGHAAGDLRSGFAIGRDRDVRRRLHQRDLGGRFDDATGTHDAGVATRFDAELSQAIEGEEARRLFHADGAFACAVRLQPIGEQCERAFVLIPDPDVGGHLQVLAHGGLFECRCHEDGLTVRGDQRCGQSFAAPPLNAGEVDERAAGLDQQRLQSGGAHELLRLRDALHALGTRDRRRQRAWPGALRRRELDLRGE